MRVRVLPLVMVAVFAIGACTDSSKDDQSLGWSPASLPAATVGQPYRATITVSNARTPVFSLEVASGTLPAGLTLTHPENESTATITGTPTRAGTFSFELAAACFGTNTSGQSGSHTFELVVG
jgi:hypothetical protein